MTNQEKAKMFIEYSKRNDPRCNILVSLLCQLYGLNEDECRAKIIDLAHGDK